MLTQILSSVPSPRPARSHILNRDAVDTVAPPESGHELWMRDRLIEAERTGEVIKLTGPRSVSAPGGDAA